jgi:hypothetical protein
MSVCAIWARNSSAHTDNSLGARAACSKCSSINSTAQRCSQGISGQGRTTILTSPACRLLIYMAATDTTTIRVPTETRDRLKALAAQRGESASEVVVKLVSAADEEAMLAEIETSFERLAGDPEAIATYRAESDEIEADFDAPTPEW